MKKRVNLFWRLFVVLSFLSFFCAPSAVMAQGLVAAYSFNEGTGTTVADSSGNGNTGTITNGSWTGAGKYSNALTFNGTSSRISINDSASLHLSTGMTLEAWVYPAVAVSGWRDVIYKQDDIYYLEAGSSNGTPAAGGTFGNGNQNIYATSALPVNAWTHLAVTFDGVNLRLWINGVSVSTQAQTSPLITSGQPLQIGGDSLYGQYFTGRIDEVRVYNQARTQNQIELDMNTPVSSVGDTSVPTVPTNFRAFAGGTPASVIARQSYLTTNSLASHTTASFNSTGGDLIVVFASSHENVATMSISDNKANTWISAAGPANHPSASVDLRSQFWYAKAAKVGTGHTVKLTLSSAQSLVMSVLVIKGSNITTPIDVTSSISDDGGVSTTSITSASINTTQPADLLLDFAKTLTSVTWTAGNGYTYESAASSNYLGAEDSLAGPSGAYSAQWTMTPGTNWQNLLTSVVSANASAGSSQITMTWNPSTDDIGVTGYQIERCQGAGCSTFTQIGSTTGFSTTYYTDTALPSGSTYSYRIRATDAAGNLSLYSTTATATTTGGVDTSAPTAPTNLTATAPSTTQINLTWTASTDNVGVTGYLLERCQGTGCTNFAQIASPAVTTYSDTGLTADVTYSYRVRATDAAGNLSGYSNTATATTSSSDTTPPTTPLNVRGFAGGTPASVIARQGYINATALTVHTTASFDSTGGDLIVVFGSSHANVTMTLTDSKANTWTSLAGPTNHTPPVDLRSQIWYANAANVGTGHAVTLTLSAAQPVVMSVLVIKGSRTAAPIDASTNITDDGGTSTTSITSGINTTQPADLLLDFAKVATGVTWTAGAGYTFESAASSNFLGTEDALALSTGGYIANWAITPASNWQNILTSVVSANASMSSSQITLMWNPSTDNIGVTGYLIERCTGAACSSFTQVGSTSGAGTASYTDMGLSQATTYVYRIRATDAAGNLSTYSSTVTAATTDPVPPTAPTNLTSAASSTSQINLAWTASTDNVAVTGYQIERCQGAGCTTFAQSGTSTSASYSDGGLSAASGYSYRVRATDAAGNLSPYSNTTSATTDTPPTAPTNLTGVPLGGTQMNLSWEASAGSVGIANYLVERCQGAGCSTFTQIATSTTTAYTDTGLTSTATYSYRVRAIDVHNNLSGYSNTASATTPDTVAPSTPTNVTATAPGSTQINLTWTASTDNVAVTGYLLERCQGAGCATFAQIASPTGTSYSDTGLTAGTSYSYRLRATDAAGNPSGYSNVATAITPVPDSAPPTAPSNLTTATPTAGQINLAWSASTDNIGVSGYMVERCQGAACSSFVQIATPSGTSYNDGGLPSGTTYNYRVRATDAAGNLSPYSNTSSATTLTTISGLVAAYSFNEGIGTTVADSSGTGNAGTIGNATWTTAGRFGNALSFNGTNALVTITDSNSLHLTTGMTLEAWVRPSVVTNAWRDVIYKANDNYFLEGTSPNNAPAGGGTFASGVLIYGTAALAANTWTHLTLTYDGATLRLYANGTQVSSLARTGTIATSTNPLQIGGDSPYGQYFNGTIDEVRVYNVALTAAQIQTDMNTPVGDIAPDTQPPTAPTNLTSTAAGNQINLTWTASTDNVSVTQYLLERCQDAGCTTFTQIAVTGGATTTYSDPGLAAATSYSYRVRATDAAANPSPYSNVTSATTQSADTDPPTAPANLTVTAVSGSQLNLSWTASTDNIGVTGYRVDRCQGAGCTNFSHLATTPGTTFSDTGLLPATTYSYQVRATDAAGNLSGYSNAASATTQPTIGGLVTALSFSEGTGTTVGDSSGNGNDGTAVSATWTPSGKYGNAMVFNGTSARVTINDTASLHLTTAMTLEAWVNPSVVNAAWRDVIYKGNDNYFLEATSNTGTSAAGGTFSSSSPILYGTTLPLSAWTHLALTYDGTTLRLYVNGTQVSSTPQTGSLVTSTNPLQIGGDSLYGQYFAGTIDEIRVYNTALTAAQIQSDMNTPIGSGGLPAVTLSSTNLTFNNQVVGTTSNAQTVTLTNTGTATLSISSITISGAQSADFVQTNNCGTSVVPNGNCTINVTFTPTATGSRNATVAIADNAVGSPQTIALSGSGVTSGGFSISPRVTTLTFTRTQQFTGSGSNVVWSVDGIPGGSASAGTINSTGLYTPPATAGVHTVTVTTQDQSQSASATAYISNYAGTFTHHNDNLRTGQNLNETALTPANTTVSQFGKLLSYPLDGMAFASPLYVANVNIPGQGFHNVVYVATEHDSVYAFDADGVNTNPLWKVSFINESAAITTVPPNDTGECCDIPLEIGITGTPVIDPTTGTLYVVAKTREPGGYVQRLHALDITTGAEKFGGPVVLQASVPGTGSGAQGGQVQFDALRENQRPALLLSNGVVYIAFSGHGDYPPYHGWVLGYNASTLQRVMMYNATANGVGAGVWMGGGGPATDSTGNIYFTTANGTFDVNTGGIDYGDTFLKINSTGAVLDYFTPFDQSNMDVHNWDLGSGGLLLLPDQPGANPHLMLSAGKTGTMYLMNRDNLGRFNPSNNNQIVQSLVNIFPNGTPEPGSDSAPVYFNGRVYFSPINERIMAFQLNNGLLSTSPSSQSSTVYTDRGGTLTISANGSSDGILWAVEESAATTPGILHAYNPANLGVEYYNSNQAGARDTLDTGVKFNVPVVANGKVFVVSQTQLTVFGLLP